MSNFIQSAALAHELRTIVPSGLVVVTCAQFARFVQQLALTNAVVLLHWRFLAGHARDEPLLVVLPVAWVHRKSCTWRVLPAIPNTA